MLNISKMYVVQVLYEMIAAIERPLRFRLISALLVLMASHMIFIRSHLTAERARRKRCVLGVATYQGGAKSMYGVFMTNPLVLGFESARTECAAEWKVLLEHTSTVETIVLRPGVRRLLPLHSSATASPSSTEG